MAQEYQITIRTEIEADFTAVEQLIENTFATVEFSDQQEHKLVNRLRTSNAFIPELSLVAELENKIVGYCLFTKAKINNLEDSYITLALAPVAVSPKFQSRGIGSKLIINGLARATTFAYKSIIVMGHDKYYPRFGFVPASNYNINAPFEVANEYFMALELQPDSLRDVLGIVEYAPEFFE